MFESMEKINKIPNKNSEELFELKEETKEEVSKNLNSFIFLKQAMQKCFDGRNYSSASKIAIALNDPESAKQAIQKCFDEEDIDSAGKIAVALAGNDPESAKQAMQKCFDKGSYSLASEIAVALADKDPESAKQVMQKRFDEGDPVSAGKIAIALKSIFKPGKEFERILKVIDKAEAGIYGQKIVANLLEQNQDLQLFQKEYLPRYIYIKKLAEKENSEIEESKKWKNTEEFFNKYGVEIANLQTINLNLSTQLLKSFVSRGLSFAEANIRIYKPILEDKEISSFIQEYVKTNKKLDGYNFGDLLEISSAYFGMGRKQALIDILKTNKMGFDELKKELNSNLLKQVAGELGLKTEVSDQEISKWKIKYLANLLTNKEMLNEENDEENLSLYNDILKSCFEDRFQDFISNEEQGDELGWEIARHNKEVEEIFKKHGINWDNWLVFKEQGTMEVGTAKKNIRDALFFQFEQRFKEWQEQVIQSEPRLKSSLEKDLTQLTQKKKDFDPSKININDPQWIETFLPTYFKSLNYIKAKNSDFKLSPESEELFSHLVETIRTLTQEQTKEQTSKKTFIVKLWDRDPRKDLFQGNETHCCISVGVKETPPGGGLTTFHPETILQYLIDKGVNVVEIVDPETNDVAAQVWIFVSLDKDNKPMIVADNFEVNNRYPAGNNINGGIRESMFKFLKEYAKECNISKVVLGKVGTNDVETSELKTVYVPEIEKLGGYFNEEEYYLETLGDKEVMEIVG